MDDDVVAGSALPSAMLAIDKGTFDAISLGSVETDDIAPASGTANRGRDGVGAPRVRALCAKFKANLLRMLGAPTGDITATFLVTSCNWTGEELRQLFAPEFVAYDEVAHPSFTFGGRRGQTVTTLAFRLAAIADPGHE